MEKRIINWADIWVLQAIQNCTKDGDFDLVQVIAIADYINHAILAPEEFNNAVYKLKDNGLLHQSGDKLELTQKAQALFEKHENKSVHKLGSELQKELNAVTYGPGYNPNILVVPEEFVSKAEFNNAIKEYQRKYGF